MLKRNGELIQHEVPGYSGGFTDSELASYNAAFATIERDYKQLENVKSQLERLAKSNWEMETNPKPFDTVSTPDGTQWKAYGILVNLPRSDVLLCRKAENEWAVIQQLKTNGPYAETHGKSSVLLTGNNPREVANEYIGQAEHTLRFMARNLTAKAQEVVWEKYPDNNPSRVMRAISERCALAVDNPNALQQRQEQSIDQGIKKSRGMSI
jgi:hypothetical protein